MHTISSGFKNCKLQAVFAKRITQRAILRTPLDIVLHSSKTTIASGILIGRKTQV